VEELSKKDSAISQLIIPIDSSMIKKKAEEVVDNKPDGKPFYFKLISSQSGNEVMGEIHIEDSKGAQYQAFKGNEMFYLMPPKNNTGVYQASIQALGYKPANLTFDYKDPAAVSTGVGEKQETIFTFELARIKKGDYIDFNSVRFFSNSNILEPPSQGELDELTAIMKNDQAYKVKIHGHCNGTEPREIVTLGSGSNFFAKDATKNKKETATPKKLTEYRAETIKNYLVSQGIDEGRISIKGEGGKMMIYPPTSTLANYNDRVEIEVLKTGK
jgi:outer membrane protein OmpA-like peptidoglycan-associated protein